MNKQNTITPPKKKCKVLNEDTSSPFFSHAKDLIGAVIKCKAQHTGITSLLSGRFNDKWVYGVIESSKDTYETTVFKTKNGTIPKCMNCDSPYLIKIQGSEKKTCHVLFDICPLFEGENDILPNSFKELSSENVDIKKVHLVLHSKNKITPQECRIRQLESGHTIYDRFEYSEDPNIHKWKLKCFDKCEYCCLEPCVWFFNDRKIKYEYLRLRDEYLTLGTEIDTDEVTENLKIYFEKWIPKKNWYNENCKDVYSSQITIDCNGHPIVDIPQCVQARMRTMVLNHEADNL